MDGWMSEGFTNGGWVNWRSIYWISHCTPYIKIIDDRTRYKKTAPFTGKQWYATWNINLHTCNGFINHRLTTRRGRYKVMRLSCHAEELQHSQSMTGRNYGGMTETLQPLVSSACECVNLRRCVTRDSWIFDMQMSLASCLALSSRASYLLGDLSLYRNIWGVPCEGLFPCL